MANFLSLIGGAAANDLNIGGNPALKSDMSEEDIKKRKKQLLELDQAQNGVGRAPSPFSGASMSLLGR